MPKFAIYKNKLVRPEDIYKYEIDANDNFQCTQCGNCCTGAPGYVWVNNEEIAALAREIGETALDRFREKYVRNVGIRKSLRELPGTWDCVFFDSVKRCCTVYDARPRQCRTWPNPSPACT